MLDEGLEILMETIQVPTRLDGNFMPEGPKEGDHYKKNILIVDDINDTGKTLCWIKDDWKADDAWGNNVRTACLIDNSVSDFDILDYTALEINKHEDPTWVVFPWEGERDYGNF